MAGSPISHRVPPSAAEEWHCTNDPRRMACLEPLPPRRVGWGPFEFAIALVMLLAVLALIGGTVAAAIYWRVPGWAK